MMLAPLRFEPTDAKRWDYVGSAALEPTDAKGRDDVGSAALEPTY